MLTTYPEHIACVTAALFLLVLVSKSVEGTHHASSAERSSGRRMIEQAKAWYHLSLQDRKPLNAYEHSVHAIAYLTAARHMAADSILEEHSGVNVHSLLKSATQTQQDAMREISKQCPKMKPKSK